MKIEIYQQKIQTVCLLVLTAIAIAAALKLFSAVLIPFVLAVFLTFCFAPVIEAQMKLLHAPRSIAMVSTIILVCIVLVLVGIMISASVGQIADNREAYQLQIANLLNKVVDSINLEKFGAETKNFSDSLLAMLGDSAKKVFGGTVSGILAILSNGVLVLIFMIFMLSTELSIAAKVLAIAIPSAIQFGIGNLLQPKLMGRSLDLHPVAILLALIFFGAIWGIIGMLLATPITAVLKILLEKFEYTRSLANLLAGRADASAEGTGESTWNLDKTGEPSQ